MACCREREAPVGDLSQECTKAPTIAPKTISAMIKRTALLGPVFFGATKGKVFRGSQIVLRKRYYYSALKPKGSLIFVSLFLTPLGL